MPVFRRQPYVPSPHPADFIPEPLPQGTIPGSRGRIGLPSNCGASRSPTHLDTMRPLAVLILIVGAVAALIFALTAITGDSGDPDQTNIVRPNPRGPTVVIDTPVGDLPIVDPAQALPGPGEEDRTAVEVSPGAEPGGVGGIEGTVVDPEGSAVAGALEG